MKAGAMVKHAGPDTLVPFVEATLFGFELSKTGIRAVGKPSFEQWQQLGDYLRFMDESIQWLIGDWLVYGEATYAEKMSQALSATDVEAGTVKAYGWVSENVPPENRDAGLSFSHHKEVADLPPSQQRKWLKRAKAGNADGRRWSVDQLRQAINQAKRQSEGHEAIYWIHIGCKTIEERDKLQEMCEKKGRRVTIP